MISLKSILLAYFLLFSTILAHGQCSPGFTWTASGSTVAFTNTSTGSTPTTDYIWTFGDLSPTQSTPSPTHTYAVNGAYTVCLGMADSLGGCPYTSFCDTVYITGGTNCSASFTYSVASGVVSFTQTSAGVVTYQEWDFGDGSNSTVANPMKSYSAPGTYAVTLIIASAGGCRDTVIQTVVVPAGSACNAAISTTVSGATLVATSSGSVGAYTTSQWDFGDGSAPAFGDTVTHTYTSTGNFTVCVVIQDSLSGCFDSACDTIYATGTSGPSCDADFYTFPDTSGTYGIMAVNTSTGTNLNYLWDFGDGNTSTLAYPMHTYAGTGTYVVCLTVSDSTCSDTHCDTIAVTMKNLSSLTFFVMDPVTGLPEQVQSETEIAVFPNPFSNEVNFSAFGENEIKELEIVLRDLSGRKVYSESRSSLMPGETFRATPGNSIPAGVYLLEMKGENFYQTSKLIRMHKR